MRILRMESRCRTVIRCAVRRGALSLAETTGKRPIGRSVHPSALSSIEVCCWSSSQRIGTVCPHPARGLLKGPRFCFSPTKGIHIQDTTKKVRVNKQIRISPIRVIAADGAQLGIMEVDAALAAAIEQGLDLVEVAPMARPPVARIMDYGKFKRS